MKLYPDSKVYIICPSKQHSGGPELCHQLCSQLISLGINSRLVYIFTRYFYAVDKIQCVIWWLSVDNYLQSIRDLFQYFSQNSLIAPLTKFFSFHKADGDIEHFVQSEYARQFVKLNGVPDDKIHWVEDYLGQDFLIKAAQVDKATHESCSQY